jgi:hypothetical protein
MRNSSVCLISFEAAPNGEHSIQVSHRGKVWRAGLSEILERRVAISESERPGARASQSGASFALLDVTLKFSLK